MHLNNAQEVNMWQYNYTNPDNELYHYGVAGMKWGVRRIARRDKNLRAMGRQLTKDERTYGKAINKLQRSYDKLDSKTFGSSARQTGKRIDNEREKQAIQSKIDSMTKQLMAKQGKYKLSAEKVYNQSKAGKSKVDRALKKKKK